MRGVFVTGTDTGVGKTVVSAWLVRKYTAHYWKPVQTGLASEAGDTATIAALTGADPARLHPPRHALQAPLSPEAAARLENTLLALEDFSLPETSAPLVVEGAGGLLVPLNETALMIDLIARLALPVLLVARTTLGTINHTLLSLEALRARNIPLDGVVLAGAINPGNAADIAHHGKTRIVAQLPWVTEVSAAVIERWARGE